MAATFVISLDFELLWGVRDVLTLHQYRDNLLGERVAVDALLAVFAKRRVHATWATVGALFCSSKDDLIAAFPTRLPRYRNSRLSPYEALHELGRDEASDPFHYAPSLVEKISKTPGQELATHTFSHFYCLEEGQTAHDFDEDLAATTRVASKFGSAPRSIVFPRNQYNPTYRWVLKKRGVRTYRSNGSHWAYRPSTSTESRVKRLTRLADTYIALSGPRTSSVMRGEDGLTDVPASAFLRPYNRHMRHLDILQLRRITAAMTHAARTDQCFHLWWHPHNFGANLIENLAFLDRILDHLDDLRARQRMTSATMLEAAEMASA